MMVVGHHHYLVFLSFVCSGIAFALNGNHQNMQNDVECPKNWTKIGTGCYLFAIPEILATDNACKLDGCTKEEAIEYCSMKHGYLVEYQLVEEFEMVRAVIKETLGSYWFWVGTSYNEMNEYRYWWTNSGTVLASNSPMWEPDFPDNLPRYCVLHTYLSSNLINYKCSGWAYPLCEMF